MGSTIRRKAKSSFYNYADNTRPDYPKGKDREKPLLSHLELGGTYEKLGPYAIRQQPNGRINSQKLPHLHCFECEKKQLRVASNAVGAICKSTCKLHFQSVR
ncbi:hypothetical protein CEXT_696831 [Caerostris extrusa]|uniref:Uncharacterized protein n=1 Tax=Caerostris extrusa TaxID=172846 RepID=A0AAV4SZC7_CAEEX|nr:hypothetical protein CEXT_696831 [Caerostris extrusa]